VHYLRLLGLIGKSWHGSQDEKVKHEWPDHTTADTVDDLPDHQVASAAKWAG
jgi:hypothetical protein